MSLLHRCLIEDLALPHDPKELLADLIRAAYMECRREGVQLVLAPIECLTQLNRRHLASWAPLLGVFDHRLGQIDQSNSYCIVGLSSDGEIVYSRAARLYTIAVSTSFAELTQSMRHIYARTEDAPATESWSITGPALTAMHSISGRIAFSGAVWCHPDYRKKGFTRIASHLGRAYSQGLWNTDYTVTFMAKGVVTGGHAKRTGYSNVAWTIHSRGASIGDLDIAFLWMSKSEALAKIRHELQRARHNTECRNINLE